MFCRSLTRGRWDMRKTIMDYYDQGVTYEDIHGNVLEEEAYLDAIDKQECDNKCWFSWMEYHKFGCPLYTEFDKKRDSEEQSRLDWFRGK